MNIKEAIRRLKLPDREAKKSTIRYLHRHSLVSTEIAPLVAAALDELRMPGDSGFIDMVSHTPCEAFFPHYIAYLGKRSFGIRSQAFGGMRDWLEWAGEERKEQLLSLIRNSAKSGIPVERLDGMEMLARLGEASRDEFLDGVVECIIAAEEQGSDIAHKIRTMFSGENTLIIAEKLDEKGRPDLAPRH